MADLRKKVLGTVSGAVGDILFREKNGKNYIGTKPSSFIPGSDERSVARRQKFAMATRLSKPINSNYLLKSVWRLTSPAVLSPYNKIVRANYNNVQADSVGDLVKLVPDIGFSVQVNSSVLDENRLRIVLNGITENSGINPAVELYFQLAGVLHLSSPNTDSNDKHIFLKLNSDEQPLALNTELNFDQNFFDQTSQLIRQYNNRRAFLTLLSLDAERQVVNYSNTFIIT